MSETKKSYHHGDLRVSLQEEAATLIREQGIEGLSMRKLADRVGVSRSAPYHHFSDKQELLCAIAERGFLLQEEALKELQLDDLAPLTEQVRQFIRHYVSWSVDHPEYYDLMFGREIWRSEPKSESFVQSSHGYFRRYVERVEAWQQEGLLGAEFEALRFAQVSWSTMHGLARLLIDGIYIDRKALDAMCDTAADMFFSGFTTSVKN